jgi:hypothetical protein
MSTDRSNPAGAIPVYIVAAPPFSSSNPSMNSNALAAMPVYFVAQPTQAPGYPNGQGSAQGAIPVRVVANPPTGLPSWEIGNDSGAIPVYDVGGPQPPPWGNNQTVKGSACPVWRVN